MKLPIVMQNFLLHLNDENKSTNTLNNYSINLQDFTNYFFKDKEPTLLDFEQLSTKDLSDWLKNLEVDRGLSIASINQRIATLKKFYNYMVDTFQAIESNPTKQLKLKKHNELYERPILTQAEVRVLLETVNNKVLENNNYTNHRNELIINLFLSTGMRIAELSNIMLGDIKVKTQEIVITGKGNKKRIIKPNETTWKLLENYLVIRDKQIHSDDNALFLSRQKSGEGSYKLSTDQIRKMVVSVAKEADVTSITPHSLRHTHATLSFQNGVDVLYISKNLGHSSTAITERIYIHQTSEGARQVAQVWDTIF